MYRKFKTIFSYFTAFFSAVTNSQPRFLFWRDDHIWTDLEANSKYTSVELAEIRGVVKSSP